MLSLNSSGPVVSRLQEMLNLAIPTRPLLVVDGIFGPKTLDRVRQFQRQNGLTVDGIVGPITGRALVTRVWTGIVMKA